MKRWFSILVVLMLLIGVIPGKAAAQSISVDINGETVTINPAPVMMNGRVLVPLRAISEALGAEVTYLPEIQGVEIKLGSTLVELTIGSADAMVAGQPIRLDQPAIVMGGSTMVPLRFVGEALGIEVRWESASQTVSLTRRFDLTGWEAPGNSPGNSATYGLAATDGEWVYFSHIGDGRRLYKMRLDGSDVTKINDDAVWNLNVSDGWLYYVVDGPVDGIHQRKNIVRMRTDGSERTVIPLQTRELGPPDNLISVSIVPNPVLVLGDWIYYADSRSIPRHSIYRRQLDGSQLTELAALERWASPPSLTASNDGWLYYTSSYYLPTEAGVAIWRMRPDGSDKRIFLKKVAAIGLTILGDWLYYEEELPDRTYALKRTRTDGSVTETISSGGRYTHRNHIDEWVYYVDGDHFYYGNLYRIKVDGTSKQKLTDHLASNVQVIGDWIYYERQVTPGSWLDNVLYRTRPDGSERAKLVGHEWVSDPAP